MRVKIQNYEALKDIDIEIPVGLTQLAGKTNQGKSSLVRAIEDFYCSGAGKDEITIDESQMMIQIDDDYFTRNFKTKEYFINGISYKNIGRGKFPELAFLKLGPVNFQHQQEARFLIGDTPGQKYNYIVGERDDKFLTTLNNMKKDSKEMVSTNKVLIAQYTENESKLEKIEEDLKNTNFEKAISLKKNILSVQEKIKKLESIFNLKSQLDFIKEKQMQLKQVEKETISVIELEIKKAELLHKDSELKEIIKKGKQIKVLGKDTILKFQTIINYVALKKNEELVNNKKTLSKDSIEAMRSIFKQIMILNSNVKLESIKKDFKEIKTIDIKKLTLDVEDIEYFKLGKIEIAEKNLIKQKGIQGLMSIKEAEIDKAKNYLEQLKEELGVCPLCGNSFKHEH